jgi:hypothetical protein
LADYLDPESKISEREVAEFIFELFDNPTNIEAYEREMERGTGGRDADSWHGGAVGRARNRSLARRFARRTPGPCRRVSVKRPVAPVPRTAGRSYKERYS